MRETPGYVSAHAVVQGAGIGPSALLFECMAHVRISFDDVCDTSPKMWNMLNFMVCKATQHGASRLVSGRGCSVTQRNQSKANTKDNEHVRLGKIDGFGRLRRVARSVGGVKPAVDVLQLQLSCLALARPLPRVVALSPYRH
jgi:hypothetical protein